jgi:hypothetical protein
MNYFDSDMLKSTNMVVYLDWKTGIYIYVCGKCHTQYNFSIFMIFPDCYYRIMGIFFIKEKNCFYILQKSNKKIMECKNWSK